MNANQIKFHAVTALALVAALLVGLTALGAEKPVPLAAFAKLPIKEITVFKDGNAFVAHEGKMPTDDKGNVLMDYLPAPVIGTFWPYSAEKRVRLSGVVASQKRVLIERTALNLRELLEANVGAEALITESGEQPYPATILSLPARGAEEQAATNPPNSGEKLPEKGNLVLLKKKNGNRYTRVDLAGKISITSHRAQPSDMEVTRYVLGTADTADQEGKVEKLNAFEDGEYLPVGDYPYWWGWYGWPNWRNYFNGIGRITWKLTVEPAKTVDVAYEWHYFWR